MTPPPADDGVVEEGVFGQLLLQTTLEAAGVGDAVEQAAGWDGDWYVVWEAGDGVCLRTDVVMDGDDDADELEDGLTDWAEWQGGATIERLDDLSVRFSVCSDGAASSAL